jgi:tripartite-type tricarboxylate transporter receptor subunit TctC
LLSRRQILSGSLAAAASAATIQTPRAQGPARITILVGFPAGGTPDLVARLISEHIRTKTGRTIVVENRTGGAGVIAMQAAVTAQPEAGTTLILSPAELLTLYPHVQATLRYDPFADFVPVASLASNPYGIACGPLAGVKTVPDFIGWCKANSAQANFGTPGAGTPQHFIGTMFARAAGIELQHIPYRGGAPALQDLLSGQIAALVSALPLIVGQHQSGTLAVIGTTGRARTASLPGVPTLVELGYASLVEEGVMGLFGTAKAPADDISQLSELLEAYVRTPEFAQTVRTFGQVPHSRTREAYLQELRAGSERWKAVVRDTGFKRSG